MSEKIPKFKSAETRFLISAEEIRKMTSEETTHQLTVETLNSMIESPGRYTSLLRDEALESLDDPYMLDGDLPAVARFVAYIRNDYAVAERFEEVLRNLDERIVSLCTLGFYEEDRDRAAFHLLMQAGFSEQDIQEYFEYQKKGAGPQKLVKINASLVRLNEFYEK